jgi:molybdopterin synthase sulfur carrier subunit
MGLVRLYATLRPRAGGEGVLDVPWSPGATIADVIRELLRRKPALHGHILDDDDRLLPHVNVFLNGRDIRYLAGLDTAVDGDAELFIFPPVAGGQIPARMGE